MDPRVTSQVIRWSVKAGGVAINSGDGESLEDRSQIDYFTAAFPMSHLAVIVRLTNQQLEMERTCVSMKAFVGGMALGGVGSMWALLTTWL
jgi:hypothetical protein